MGSQIEHVGDVGAGTAVKMANQVLLSVSLLAAREVAGLARAEGVSIERLWEVLRTCTGTTWVVEHWPTAAAWIDGYRPGTSLDILVKDTGLALDLAAERNVPVRLLPLTAEIMAALTRESYEDRSARISILARANAHRPDTLMQTDSAKSTNLLADRAGHTLV